MYIAFFSTYIKPFTAHWKMNVCDTVGRKQNEKTRNIEFFIVIVFDQSSVKGRTSRPSYPVMLKSLPFPLEFQRMYNNWIFLLKAPKVKRIVGSYRHEGALVHQELNLNDCTS